MLYTGLRAILFYLSLIAICGWLVIAVILSKINPKLTEVKSSNQGDRIISGVLPAELCPRFQYLNEKLVSERKKKKITPYSLHPKSPAQPAIPLLLGTS